MEFFKKVEDLFNSGDPVVREWFLVKSNYMPFILCASYVLAVRIGPYFMRDRKPFDLRNVMIIFNFAIVSVYVTILSMAVYYLPNVSWKMFCWGGVLVKGEPAYILISAAWYGYVLKYVEFLDTIFFVLRKKDNQISFLHVFHHTIVPIIAWTVIRTEKNGLQAIPGIINTVVHIVMYSYYGLSAMGPKVQKYLWWKKYLTQMQIIQFILVMLFVIFLPPATGCPMIKISYIMDVLLAPIFFILFFRFYRTTFVSSKRNAELSKKAN